MQQITPFLWFDREAEEAMQLYVEIFGDARILDIKRYPEETPDTPEVLRGMQGKVLTGVFELRGRRFMALDGGPGFPFTPATSFFVDCATAEEVDRLHARLSEGGSELMPLDAYPWSDRYAWVADRFGVNWQLLRTDTPRGIRPSLLFVGDENGRSEEAMQLYTRLFPESEIQEIDRYGPDEPGGDEGTVRYGRFRLRGEEFVAMESSLEHPFTFSDAVSLYVDCADQDEVDTLWEALADEGKVLQCGWLRDRYGLTWQVIPRILPELLNDPDPERAKRAMEAMMQMKKIDVAALQEAAAPPA